MNPRRLVVALILSSLIGTSALAQASTPIVRMTITLPDGQTKDLTAPESGLATITLKEGTEIGFRPTIQDSKPWTRVVVTVFKTPTLSHASQQLGEVEVKTGGPAVPCKSTPAFKVAVTQVSEPTS